MRRISYYIAKQLTVGTVLVAAGLLCVVWLSQSLRFVELIVSRGLDIGAFLRLTGLLLPSFLTIVLPLALFGVVLFTYNRLNQDRELIVLRAAGVGPWGLARPALLLAVVFTGIGLFLSLSVVPHSVKSFREAQWLVRNDYSHLVLQEGAFNDLFSGVTVYVRERSDDGRLYNILVHDTRHPQHDVTLLAKQGLLSFGDSGPRVLLINGSRQEVVRGEGRLSLLDFDTYTLELQTRDQSADHERFRDARERSFRDLLTTEADDDPSLSAVDINRFRTEAHQRIINPLSHVVFTLIALAALFSGSFDRRGGLNRLLWAVGLVAVVQGVMVAAGNMAGRSLAFLPLVYAVVLVPGALAALVLSRPDLLSFQRLIYSIHSSEIEDNTGGVSSP